MNFILLLALFLVIASFKYIRTFNFHAKLFVYGTLTSVVMSLMIPYFLLRAKNSINLRHAAYILRHIQKLFGLKINIKGSEILQKEESAIVVANHQTSIDLPITTDIWVVSNNMSVLAKKSMLFLGGTFGIGAWLAGMRFIDRSQGQRAGEAMNRAMVDMKKKNEKLFVFPEGTRRNTEEIHEFKKGAFHAAVHAQVPIIPVVFSPYKHIFNSEEKLFTGGEIHIQVLPEISTEGMTNEDVDELMKKTRKVMIDVYEKQKNVVHNKKIN